MSVIGYTLFCACGRTFGLYSSLLDGESHPDDSPCSRCGWLYRRYDGSSGAEDVILHSGVEDVGQVIKDDEYCDIRSNNASRSGKLNFEKLVSDAMTKRSNKAK